MNKSHLLINEPALQVLPSLAKAIGLEEAIILQQLHYWLNNSKNGGRVDENGEKWIYNSYQEWQENFPFWSVQQIQRIFLNLEKGGLVISAKLDAKKHDQTKFYRLNYDALCTMDESILIPSSISESNDVNKVLAETTTENNNTLDIKTITEQANRKVDAILDMANAPGIKAEARVNSILSYLGERFRVNTDSKKWREFAKYADQRQQKHGEDIKVFVAWLYSQKGFDLTYWPPAKMMEFWPSAFVVPVSVQSTSPVKIDSDGIPETY